MIVSELIKKLQQMQSEVGDVDVTITDGYEALCYYGEFAVIKFFDHQTCQMTIDIGIGGTRQE